MSTDPPNEGARRLSVRLAELGESQAKAEQALKISDGLMSRLLSGQRKPGRRLGEAIRQRYGVEPPLWDEPPHAAAPEPSGEAA